MRIVFFGTGNFCLQALKKLINSDHEVVGVVTQPDKRKGRGWNINSGTIKAYLEQAWPGMDILQPENIREKEFIERLSTLDADVFVVIDYGKKLPEDVLNLPKKYCVNLHPSLLPKYRGAAPVNWAILNNEKKTGNTIFRMAEEMDAGDIICQNEMIIDERVTAVDLAERLSREGADLLIKALDLIESGDADLIAQDEGNVSFAPKLQKEDGRIDWHDPAVNIKLLIRAMQPWPGALTSLEGKKLKIFAAKVIEGIDLSGEPGTILAEGELIVQTGESALSITELQLEGKKRMKAEDFLRGAKVGKGTKLG